MRYAVNNGFYIVLHPHLDDGLYKGTWRNVLVFDPSAKYGAMSYFDAVIRPAANAIKQANSRGKEVYISLQVQLGADQALFKQPSIMVYMVPMHWMTSEHACLCQDGLTKDGCVRTQCIMCLSEVHSSWLIVSVVYHFPLLTLLRLCLNLQAEMGATLFYYPRQYRNMVNTVKDIVAGGGTAKSKVKIGVNVNWEKICGCPSDLIYSVDYMTDFRKQWNIIKSTINIGEVQALFKSVDWIGVSAYAGLPHSLSVDDLETSCAKVCAGHGQVLHTPWCQQLCDSRSLMECNVTQPFSHTSDNACGLLLCLQPVTFRSCRHV